MDGPFLGPQAVTAGTLTRGQLRWKYAPVAPRVYAAKGSVLSARQKIEAVALWAGGGAVIAGRAAAHLHGVRWIDIDTPIEVITKSRRTWPGVIARQERIAGDEIVTIGGMAVTSAARTAFDLGRHLQRNAAVAQLDALAAVTGVRVTDAFALQRRYPGARGIRDARTALELMDAGAQSPRETWLRLLVVDNGFPRPRTQIKVSDGSLTAFLDMGWDEPMIGLDYDGEYHLSDRRRYVTDLARDEMLRRERWIDIHVVKEHSPAYILHRLRRTWAERGFTPPTQSSR
ncbi:MAG TPA: hypothetical protein VFW21_04670 [Mycobacterium sp.]|nr:hypothetical protein [Mycobacterium sp.]